MVQESSRRMNIGDNNSSFVNPLEVLRNLDGDTKWRDIREYFIILIEKLRDKLEFAKTSEEILKLQAEIHCYRHLLNKEH